ncbi:MAG: MBL fold metallo-hydrolase [Pseudomonadota bacterium]
MRIKDKGRIVDDFFVVGHPGMPVYLLDGPTPVLFDAGIAPLAPLYVREIKEILGDRPPALLFLTHSHFDHVGAAGFFKAAWPELKIAASPLTGKVIAKPTAVSLITKLNEETAGAIRNWGQKDIWDVPFKPFLLDEPLSPGQKIELGPELTVIAIPTPGHTRDFVSYYVPQKNILVASEAVGCEQNGYIMTEFLTDFDLYRESLERLAGLETDVLCQGHHLVFTGPDAPAHIRASLVQAGRFVEMVQAFLLEQNGDLDQVVRQVKALEWDSRPWPKQAEPAYLLNTQARVKTLWARMQTLGRHRIPAVRAG